MHDNLTAFKGQDLSKTRKINTKKAKSIYNYYISIDFNEVKYSLHVP